ncbi:MAG: hypothetical protein JEY94_12780 [Melioribacteraceae bacterium]|nr:hypothetical protein [Melioribacteraceae bacterium]
MIKSYLLIFIVIILSINSFSQTVSNLEDKTTIKNQLQIKFGNDYKITDFINMSEVENNISEHKLRFISNPRDLLSNCIIFTAKEKMDSANNILGIYKNNNIIWYYDKILPSKNRNGIISATFDLTNNGEVEIITLWEIIEPSSKNYNLWIHSWDGQFGQCIIDTSYNESEITTDKNALYDIVDFEGDNIWEIVTNSVYNEHLHTTVYSYDGISFKDDPSKNDISIEKFFPRNNFSVKINLKLTFLSENLFTYKYNITNENSSKQMINVFDLYTNPDSIITINSPSGWNGVKMGKAISWSDSLNFIHLSTKNLIEPGNSCNEYSFAALGIPSISKCYLRGLNHETYFGDDLYTTVDDYENNSIVLFTVGSNIIDSTITIIEFIDTITSYTDSSFKFNWIQNEQTRDKYNSILNNAKNYLETNNNSLAKAELQKILTESVLDSSTVLTSEAFALLYYNTEYLIEQIKDEAPAGMPVKLIDSQGHLLKGGTLEQYDGSWQNVINNGNGTFIVNTERAAISLKMNYLGGWQQLNNITVGQDTVVFQTVNTTVQLKDSQGNRLPNEGIVSFYAGKWQIIDTTQNGTASKRIQF